MAKGIMTADEISRSICGFGRKCIYNPAKVKAARNNCSVTGYEADLLIFRPSGYVEEIEIKVSLSDLKREIAKKADKHHVLQSGRSIVSKFWFAIPHENLLSFRPFIPSWAGIYTLGPSKDWKGRYEPRVEREAVRLQKLRKFNESDMRNLLESTYHRCWRETWKA